MKLWLKEVKTQDKNHLYHEKQLTCCIPQRQQGDEYHKNVQSHHQRLVKMKALVFKLIDFW